jgi:hypothetical protein
MRRASLIAIGLCALACTTPRTEIVVRVETDMTQGPTATLTGIEVRAYAGDGTMRFGQRYDLGVTTPPLMLPAELGLVPQNPDVASTIRVEVDALHGDTPMFTRRATMSFARQHTLLAEVFLADRCRLPENQRCPMGQTCGANGCEQEMMMTLPDFGTDAGASDAGTMDASSASDGSTSQDASDGGLSDGASSDASSSDAPMIDAYCPFDTTRDLQHCGTCTTVCPAPTANGVAACVASACTFTCVPGFTPRGATCGPILPPTLVGPISMGHVTRRQVIFSWVLAPGTDGAIVDVCLDPACATIDTTFTATGTSGMPAAALTSMASNWRFWRAHSTDRGVTSTTASPIWAFDVASYMSGNTSGPSTSYPLLFDAQLDAYGDTAVGAPSTNEVDVYYGSATGLPTTPMPVLHGPAGSQFGASVAGAGDVNGDGFADLIVGAPGAAHAFLFTGGTTGLSTSGTMISSPAASPGNFGAAVGAAGDVNADGYGDLIIGAPSIHAAYLFPGGAAGLGVAIVLSGPAGSGFGTAVDCASDVDGDGFDDVVIGAPTEAAAYVYRGSVNGLVASPIRLAGAAGSRFGASVASGDVAGGDGYGDVVIGAPGASQIQVFVGAAGGLTSTVGFTVSGMTGYGAALSVCDTDDNGFDDIYVGGANGFVDDVLSNSSGPGARSGWTQTFDAPAGATGWGQSLGRAQIGRDRYPDVMIGAPGSVAAYWYAGRSSGFTGATVPSATLMGAPASGFGAALAERTIRAYLGGGRVDVRGALL